MPVVDKLTNIIWTIKARRTIWVGHVACTVKRREIHKGFCYENLRKRDHLEDPGTDRRILLIWMLNK
jgi:hypothetical protein